MTGQVAQPVKTIRELAKDGTPVQYLDERTGRMRKKWLAIRSSSKDRANVSSQSNADRTASSTKPTPQRNRMDSQASSTSARSKNGRARRRKKAEEGTVYKSKANSMEADNKRTCADCYRSSAMVARFNLDGTRRTWELHIVSAAYLAVIHAKTVIAAMLSLPHL